MMQENKEYLQKNTDETESLHYKFSYLWILTWLDLLSKKKI